MSDLAEAQDAYTMRCCRYIVKAGAKGLPKGETPETFGELVKVHRAALHVMKQRRGKGILVCEIGQLAKLWPSSFTMAIDEAKGVPESVYAPNGGSKPAGTMEEAREIFNGTMIEPEKPEVLLL